MDSLQSATPIVPGAPEWLTLPFVLIAAGVVVALLILWWIARLAGRRRRTEKTIERRAEVVHVEEGFEVGRPITPPASPIPPGPPETFDEPLPPSPAVEPEPVAEEPAAPEPAPEPEPEAEAPQVEAEPVAEAPAPEPEPEPVAETPVVEAEPVAEIVEHHADHLEGAALREPEPEPTPEAPNPAAEPLDASPAGEASALAEPPVAAEYVPEPEPEPVHEPVVVEAAEPEPEPAPAPAADDLTRMKGVGPRLAERLNTVGITSFAQIAALTPEEAAALDSQLGDFQGRLDRDRWIDQARFLAAGDVAGFEATFGKL